MKVYVTKGLTHSARSSKDRLGYTTVLPNIDYLGISIDTLSDIVILHESINLSPLPVYPQLQLLDKFLTCQIDRILGVLNAPKNSQNLRGKTQQLLTPPNNLDFTVSHRSRLSSPCRHAS